METTPQKIKCAVINENGTCSECKGKCTWNMHRCVPFIYDEKEIVVTNTLGEIKARYEKASKLILTGIEQDIRRIKIS